MTDKKVKILAIQFNIPLKFNMIPKWRGAVAEHVGLEDERFHNHLGAKDKYHYRYPTICYRSQQGKAALWTFGEGTQAMMELFAQASAALTMNGSPYQLSISNCEAYEHTLQMPEEMMPYYLYNWLPLNEQNIKHWDKLSDDPTKMAFLEQILASNIIAFAKAVTWQLPIRLEVRIMTIHRQHQTKHKGVNMLSFDISFNANIILPTGLGLGKAVSHGYGVLRNVE
jgi:Cas6b C-terminal domain/Cas6b N-terminal domain